MPELPLAADKACRMEQLQGYAWENAAKSYSCYLFNRLFLIYQHLVEEGSVVATAKDLKDLLEEIEP